MSNDAIKDAWNLFDSYLTLNGGVIRCFPIGPGNFMYPHPIAQQDMMVFSTIFTIVWEEIKDYKEAKPPAPSSGVFSGEYTGKPDAFAELANLAIPNGFWVMDEFGPKPTLKRQPVADEPTMFSLGRTLRNGFNHANYRYDDLSPDKYFARLDMTTPDGVTDADKANNFRIFICDHRMNTKLMAPGSKTRILDVPFAHLRYHLHLFLAKFFAAEGVGVVKDMFGSERP
jgi:hypothetical protein